MTRGFSENKIYAAKEEVVVTVKINSEDDQSVLVGNLIEIDEEGLTLQYLPTEQNSEDRTNVACEISIKSYSDQTVLSKKGVQIYDSWLPHESFFNLRGRQVRILFSEKSSLQEIIPFHKAAS